jgi:hypothetical protein
MLGQSYLLAPELGQGQVGDLERDSFRTHVRSFAWAS